ncbi:type II/IV secretion system ATPase subunit [Archaeoglobus neptunius]|uniref:type II/IV secretion system ATPase subunit n=1 Tax=Archaeoglobus neptunius TaxID=2798580 RepID=UPI001926F2CA|nr:type II/IV secretion system ATPase subunit [Archaeoglobus neptunius]
MVRNHYDILRKYVRDRNLLDSVKLDEKYRVVDEYWIQEPFIKAVIVEKEEEFRDYYNILEPTVGPEEAQMISTLFSDLKRVLVLRDVSVDIEERAEVLVGNINRLSREYAVKLDDNFYSRMLYYLFRDFFGYGVIDPLMEDPNVEDISCDGYNIPIYIYHQKYGNIETNIVLDKERLDRMVLRLTQRSGKHISLASPIVDATLPDGSRLQATFGTEVTPHGSSFTIRKFTAEPLTPVDLIEKGTVPSGVLAYLWLAIEYKFSAIVVGETASGKTTTLNAILMFVPPEAKIVSIEDTREIKLYHENWLAEVTRVGVGEGEIDMYDLLKAALRQRPDYIVVGEVRGKEAQTLFQAMSTGHASYSTLHAGDVNQMVYRLESEPLKVPRSMLQFLDIALVQTMWVKGATRFRRTKEVNEILGIDPVDKNLLVNQFVKWDPKADEHVEVGMPKKIEKIADIMGTSVQEVYEELQNRKQYLEMMVKKGVRDYKRVTKLIHAYYRNPELAMSRLGEMV